MRAFPPYTVWSMTIDGKTTYGVHGPHQRPITTKALTHAEAVVLCEMLNAAVPEPWDG